MDAGLGSVGSIMQAPLVTIAPERSVREALEHARGNGVHHLVVVRAQRLLGLVCTCDMYEVSARSRVGGVMKPRPVSIDHCANKVDAARLLASKKVGSVIVTVEGAPRGIVTRADLLRLEPELETALGNCRCECCGLTRHLRSDAHGRTLCVNCRERSSEASWLELGGAG
jgi:signal-transduction protein with cAMP-binding, CBS, and nucleotidyltransferase domain